MNELRKLLIKFIADNIIVPNKLAIVSDVDDAKMLIDVLPLDGGPELFNVRLAIAEGGSKKSGVVTIPEVGSSVIIAQLQQGVWFLIQASAPKTIMINGDSFGGLNDWPRTKLELEKMSARIDDIEQAIKTSAVGSSDGGALFQTNMKIALSRNLNKENFKNLENKIVKHG